MGARKKVLAGKNMSGKLTKFILKPEEK